MSKKDAYAKSVGILTSLKKDYPTYSLGQHISTALADYGNVWGLTDKEFLFALEKYQTELELNIVSDADVQKIVNDAKNLDTILEEDDYEDE